MIHHPCIRNMIRTGDIYSSLKGIRSYLNFDAISLESSLRWNLFGPLLRTTDEICIGVYVDLLDSSAKELLFDLNKRGFLHIHNNNKERKDMYCFHSPLHMLYYQDQLLTSSVQRIDADISSLPSFLLACISRLSKSDLNSTLSVGNNGRVLERKLQFAFCAAATSVLPKSHKICPDVGKVREFLVFLLLHLMITTFCDRCSLFLALSTSGSLLSAGL